MLLKLFELLTGGLYRYLATFFTGFNLPAGYDCGILQHWDKLIWHTDKPDIIITEENIDINLHKLNNSSQW